MDDRMRELLRDRAEDIPSFRDMPPRLQTRARRRIALTLGAGFVAATVLVVGAFAGVGAIRSAPLPADTPTPSVLQTTPPAPSSSGFVGAWASKDYIDHFGAEDTSIQTMTIRAGEDGALHIVHEDDSSRVCPDTVTTMTGTGRLEDPTTLVVPSPALACGDGSDPSGGVDSGLAEASSSFTLVLDPATDRLYDDRGVVWNRGAAPEDWSDRPSTEADADGPGTFAILHGEVTFGAAELWNPHSESYIDPKVFFLLTGPDGEAEMTIFVNPVSPETSCSGLGVPPSAEQLAQAVRSNPDLETTVPVTERVGEIDALRMDVVAAPGGARGPCNEGGGVDVVYVSGRPWGGVGPGDLGRLYLLDLPRGSARTLAILIKASDEAWFEYALQAAARVLDSFELHAE